MTDMPWFRLYPSRWLNEIRWMPPTTAHAYMVMTVLMLDREGPLADDPNRLARYANMSPASFKKALESLTSDGAIWLSDDGYMTDFVNEELAFRDSKRAKSKKALATRYAKNSTKTAKKSYGRSTGVLPEESENTPTERVEEERALQARHLPSSSSTSQIEGTTPLAEGSRRPSKKDSITVDGKEYRILERYSSAVVATDADGRQIQLFRDGNGGYQRTAPEDELDDEIPW